MGDAARTGLNRNGQIMNLGARIVVIKLARDPTAAGGEHAGQRIPQCRLPAVAHMQRTRRIGRYELD